MKTIFEKELQDLINRNSRENDSNTQDFILAEYLIACLDAFNKGVNHREIMYGRDNSRNQKLPQTPESPTNQGEE